jgi:hypothetical protein
MNYRLNRFEIRDSLRCFRYAESNDKSITLVRFSNKANKYNEALVLFEQVES